MIRKNSINLQSTQLITSLEDLLNKTESDQSLYVKFLFLTIRGPI